MQGGWARRQGRDLHAGGGAVGRRLRGVGCSISATHGVVNEHAENCANASASASTNTVKNTSASSAIFEQNDDGIHSARAKAGTATAIPEARRRPTALRLATAPTPPALPSPRGGRPARLAVARGRTERKDVGDGNGDNNEEQRPVPWRRSQRPGGGWLRRERPQPLPCPPHRRHGKDGMRGRWHW